MGCCVFKSGVEPVHSSAGSLFELHATDIDGNDVNLGELLQGKKCIIVVNVASK